MTHSSGIEKRKDPRSHHKLPLKLSIDGVDIVTETRNISSSGAYARVNEFVEPMTKLKIILMLSFHQEGGIKEKKISCQGVVVRCVCDAQQGGFFVAIFFNDITQENRQLLNQFVQQSLHQS